MLFSIIIPAYNCERTIERCLRSVVDQSFQDYEVIIIDDGSSDGTGEICKSFVANDRRFLYYYKNNGGVSTARNYGISKASGKYVAFLDSDDVYYSKYLADFFDMIIQYPTIEHFWCGYQYAAESGEQEGKTIISDRVKKISITDRAMIMTLQEKELAAPVWNKVYIRDILVDNHIEMPADLSLGEDYLFNLEYLDRCADTRIIILNNMNYGYYGFSDISLNRKYRSDMWNTYNRLLDATAKYLRKWGVSKEQLNKYYNTAFYMYDHTLRNTFHVNNKDSFLRKYQYNNHILRSRRFRYVLKLCSVSVNKGYLKLYSFGNYGLLMLADRLILLKNNCAGRS